MIASPLRITHRTDGWHVTDGETSIAGPFERGDQAIAARQAIKVEHVVAVAERATRRQSYREIKREMNGEMA